MNEIDVFAFYHAILKTHGAHSKLMERVHVVEKFKGETVWEGEVLVFDLIGSPHGLVLLRLGGRRSGGGGAA